MSWLPIAEGSDFPLDNLPYGVFSERTMAGAPHPAAARRVGVAIGDQVLDIGPLLKDSTFAAPSLNPFLAQGPARWAAVRTELTNLLTDHSFRSAVSPHLHRIDQIDLHLPFEVADYVDFYASEHHAAHVGRLFRPGSAPLTPNWKHLPIGYHGRAGTVVVSGTDIVRPRGQTKGPDDDGPTDGPSARLDLEVELGFVVGTPSVLGRPVPCDAFADHVFGVVLLNDWSARDIQAWEYVPLGPFLGKSFATSISPWVVPLAALQSARVRGPIQDPKPLDYLRCQDKWGLDITLRLELNDAVISRPPAASLYWSAAQMLAHLTAGGASVRTGDLFASGTISGPGVGQAGSLLEITEAGQHPIRLPDGSERGFLLDGDVVRIRGRALSLSGGDLGFGEVLGRISPAHVRDERRTGGNANPPRSVKPLS